MSPEKPAKKSRFNNVFFIGLLSFFGGISQDIFTPILPLYLSEVLGFGKEFIGLTEGLVRSSASIFRIIAGYLSDKLKKNKPIIFIGYFLSLITRPLLAVFTGSSAILGLRFLDGVGKGVKDSPKDVLIAASTKKENRGRGFGIARMLDTLGSVIGPIALAILLYLLRNNNLKYHYILYLTAIPLIFTLGTLVFKVKEVESEEKIFSGTDSKKLPLKFYLFLGIMAFFSIGNSSDAFLILRAQNIGVTIIAIPLVYALFNLFYALVSPFMGQLSDKIGREKVILLGFFTYALAYLGFGLASQSFEIWILFAFYGIYYATTEGVAKAFIADLVGPNYRGRAYGVYNFAIGVILLPASAIAGFLWDKFSPAATFYFGSIIAFASIPLLAVFTFYHRHKI